MTFCGPCASSTGDAHNMVSAVTLRFLTVKAAAMSSPPAMLRPDAWPWDMVRKSSIAARQREKDAHDKKKLKLASGGQRLKGCQIRQESAHGESVYRCNVRALFDEIPTPHLVPETTPFPLDILPIMTTARRRGLRWRFRGLGKKQGL
ncbi:hypothetical protein C2845_PM15G02660 [Panicum miliaceum]|uniref:Uncharacterized protein n=1 Tax=Panicum miliaceum TaxID=4540 RepID=A0A3L6Q3T7_PANMI|nr:hypothetical protein C2845_PM15G02660 [Panicum miliaceum]